MSFPRLTKHHNEGKKLSCSPARADNSSVRAGDARQQQTYDWNRLTLEAAIAKLAPGYRAVLVLFDCEGLSHEEIAAQMKCSVGTTKSQLHKARMKLRELLLSPGNAGAVGAPRSCC